MSKLEKVFWTFVAVAMFTTALLFSDAKAQADNGIGCETIRWGFLGSQRRTICDGPKRADGSWMRAREIWSPEGYVPLYCYYGCSGGYWKPRGTVAFEKYPVTDATVLPDEPAWMPAGHLVIR